MKSLQVFLRHRPGSKNWHLVIRVAGSQERVLSTRTSKRREAEKFRDQIRAKLIYSLKNGPEESGGERTNDRKRGSNHIAISELIDRYISERRKTVKDSTFSFYKYRRIYLVEKLGTMKASSVNQEVLGKYIDERFEDGAGESTIRHEINLLKGCFRMGVSRWSLTCNPFPGINYRVAIKRRERDVSQDEWLSLSSSLDVCPRRILVFGLHTGLRAENLVGLRKEWVNLEKRMVSIPAAFHKNKKRHVVYLNDTALLALKEAWADTEKLRGVSPDAQTSVFMNTKERRYTVSGFYRAFKKAAAKAGITDIHPHDMRHSFCSMLAASEVSAFDVKTAAGHRDLRSSERYVHPDAERCRKVVSLLDEEIGEKMANATISNQK